MWITTLDNVDNSDIALHKAWTLVAGKEKTHKKENKLHRIRDKKSSSFVNKQNNTENRRLVKQEVGRQ